MVSHEEIAEVRLLQEWMQALTAQKGIRLAFICDETGQIWAQAGQVEGLDMLALSTLTAADRALAKSMAQLTNQAAFCESYREGTQWHLLTVTLLGKAILVLLFDRSLALGFVRFWLKQHLPPVLVILPLFMEKWAKRRALGDDIFR